MRNNSRKIMVKSGSKAKAVVAAGAGVAMLLGGASTFARWAAQGDVTMTDDTEIRTGQIVVDGISGTLEGWYDISPEIADAGYTYPSNGYNNTEGAGGLEIINDTNGSAAVIGGYDVISGSGQGGFEIDPALFRMVPGDIVAALYTLENPDVELVGEHLLVQVGGADATEAYVDDIASYIEGTVLTANELEGLEPNEVLVVLNFTLDDNVGTNLAGWVTDHTNQSDHLLTEGLSVADLKVVVEQVREGE